MSQLPTWGLPRKEVATISDIGRGNFATFMVNDEPYAYDFDEDRLLKWDLSPTNDPKEIVTSGPFMHYFRRIVGTDGKEFRIHLPKRHLGAEVFLPPER